LLKQSQAQSVQLYVAKLCNSNWDTQYIQTPDHSTHGGVR